LETNQELKFEWLWACHYWDGPLSGVVVLENGTLAWAACVGEHEPLGYRRFNLYGLTQEQWQRELRVHADFQRYVGYHMDYPDRNNGVRYQGTKEDADVFYNKYPLGSIAVRKEYKNGTFLGTINIKWYDDMEEDD
jgi:hypothetical protein